MYRQMKNRLHIRLISVLVLGLVILYGCSDDQGGDDKPNTSLIFGKWWYDSDDFAADLYFHSDGKFEQKVIVLGNEFMATGDWSWDDESMGIMVIENISGTNQIATTLWVRFSDIKETSITIEQSLDGGQYSKEVYYVDTEN